MIEELCKKIYSHEDFQKDYILASKISSKKNFLDDFSVGEFELDSEKILKLLQCATTFALSKDIQFRKVAYNIAIICRNIVDFICLENSDKYKILISLILSTQTIIITAESAIGTIPKRYAQIPSMSEIKNPKYTT